MKTSIRIILALLTVLAVASSCSEDYFDQAAYDKLISDAFPVVNVDSTQTWKTIGTGTATLGVNTIAGETYKVKIFSGNPLSSDAKILASVNVLSGDSVTTTFSYPLADSLLFVAFIDPKGYMSVMSEQITDNKIKATFGIAKNSTSAASVIKRAYYYAPDIPTMSYSDMQDYGIQLQNVATELTPTYATQSYNCPKNLKISSGTCNYSIPTLDQGTRTLYVGKNVTWALSDTQNLSNKCVIFLDEGATLVIPDGMSMIADNKCTIIVMKNAKITGNELIIANGYDNDTYTYNAGTINVKTFDNNGGYFYNANELITSSYLSTSQNGLNINRGSITVNGDANLSNSALYNACKFVCTGDAVLSYLNNGDGSYFESNTYTSSGTYLSKSSRYVFLGFRSIVNIKGLFSSNGYTNIIGPYTYNFDNYAIFQCELIPLSSYTPFRIENSVFICRKTFYSLYTYEGYWTERHFAQCFNQLSGGYNGQAKQAYYCQVDFVKDEDECSPQYTPDDPSTPTWTTFSERFCYEDNFPVQGDYDFNDAVITITPSVSGSTVKLKVSLDAVGATKQIGAALHIAGVNRSEVTSITRDGDFDKNNGRPASSATIINSAEDLLPASMVSTTDMVINLFNDAHWSMVQTKSVETADVQRYFYNTVSRGNAYVGYQNDVPSAVVTYTIQLSSEAAAQKFVAANLDAFILEKYNGTYWEVHTYPYNTQQILGAYNNKDMTQYSSNYPWAVMVPGDFKYPIEWTKVGGANASSVYEGAYQTPGHAFGQWAQDKSTATDWYQYPTSGMVYQ